MKQAEVLEMFERLGLEVQTDAPELTVVFGGIRLVFDGDDGTVDAEMGDPRHFDDFHWVDLPVRTVEELEQIARIFKANT